MASGTFVHCPRYTCIIVIIIKKGSTKCKSTYTQGDGHVHTHTLIILEMIYWGVNCGQSNLNVNTCS